MKSQVLFLTLIILTCCSLDAAAQVQDSRKYRVTAYKNGNPSVSSTSNTVQVIPFMSIYIPNSFTPNGDGLNDTFGAYGEAISDYNMQIFNRWGQLVFESNNYKLQWDGKHNGKAVPQGSYVYRLNAKGKAGNITQKDGTVTVVY